VLGNAKLTPERANDVEATVAWASTILSVRAAAFAGHLDDAIVYVNRDAFTVEPVNTGGVWRAGGEVRVAVTPTSWSALDVVGSALASRLDATGAALPAPPFASRIAVRLGDDEGPHARVVVRSRATTPSNLFGTLSAPGTTLVDVVGSWPLASNLRVALSIENALDVLDARDTNLLPLPGRQVFASLEVRP
jgi:outer membrane receptor protein involved in Fe transport